MPSKKAILEGTFLLNTSAPSVLKQIPIKNTDSTNVEPVFFIISRLTAGHLYPLYYDFTGINLINISLSLHMLYVKAREPYGYQAFQDTHHKEQ